MHRFCRIIIRSTIDDSKIAVCDTETLSRIILSFAPTSSIFGNIAPLRSARRISSALFILLVNFVSVCNVGIWRCNGLNFCCYLELAPSWEERSGTINTNRREVKLLHGTRREKSILKTSAEATNRRINITEAFYPSIRRLVPPSFIPVFGKRENEKTKKRRASMR